MEWLRLHPYVGVSLGVGILILLGGILVGTRTATAPRETRTWSGVSGILSNPAYGGSGIAPDADSRGTTIFEQVRNAAPFTYTVPTTIIKEDVDLSSLASSGSDEGEDFDFDAFIALLSTPLSGADALSSEDSADDPGITYEFIPQGFIATSTPQNVTRTPTQAALFDYGNELGSSVQSFEDLNPGQTQILTDSIEDRGNADKAAAVERIAEGMKALARTLEDMDPVPALAVSLNAKMAAHYRAMGETLLTVPRSNDDSTLLDAINSYNAAVDLYVEDYVALATLFSASGVTFGPDDPGNMFTFTAVSL